MISRSVWAISASSGLGFSGSVRQPCQVLRGKNRAQTRLSAQRDDRRKLSFRQQLRRRLGKPAVILEVKFWGSDLRLHQSPFAIYTFVQREES